MLKKESNNSYNSALFYIKERFLYDLLIFFIILVSAFIYTQFIGSNFLLNLKSAILGFFSFISSFYLFIIVSNLNGDTYSSFFKIVFGVILKYIFFIAFCFFVFKLFSIDLKIFILSFVFTLILSNIFSFKYLNKNN